MATEISIPVTFPGTIETSIAVTMQEDALPYPDILRRTTVPNTTREETIDPDTGRVIEVQHVDANENVLRIDSFEYSESWVKETRTDAVENDELEITTDSATGRSTIRYNPSAELTLEKAKRRIRNHPGEEPISIGTEISVPWTDTNGNEYDNKMILVHYGYFLREGDEEPSWMGIFMSKYASAEQITYDAAEKLKADEQWSSPNVAYYSYKNSTYTFRVQPSAMIDLSNYRQYGTLYKDRIKDTSCKIIEYGYTRWSRSAVRKWLNSDKAASEWWSSSHTGDLAPSQATTLRGYLGGFREEDLNAMQTIKVTTALNTVTDEGTEDTYDKMWLPSISQVYGVEVVSGEGDAWADYWGTYKGMSEAKNTAASERIFQRLDNTGTAAGVCLRSGHITEQGKNYYITTSGLIQTGNDIGNYRAVACCAVG